MIRGRRHLVIFLLIFSLVWAACTQQRDPCLQPKIASLIVHTKQAILDTGVVTILDSVIASPFIGAINGDSVKIVYYGANTSPTFTLSLSPDVDSCRWLFGVDSTTPPFDTLTFRYQRKLQFLSNACGYSYFYNLTGVNTTNHNIDSVIIENTSVTNNVNTEHLKIYIRHS